MKTVLFKNDNELNNIFKDYYLFLLDNDFDSKRSFEFIFNILDYLTISSKYLQTITFDSNINSFGMFIPNKKTIIINFSKLKGCYYLNFIDKKELILSYLNLIIHEITHVYQKFYKDNFCDDFSEVLRISECFRLMSKDDFKLYYFFPDEIHANLNSSVYLYNLEKNNNLSNKLNYLEKRLIYYMTLGIIRNNQIINSQLKYLYKELLGIGFEEKFDSLKEIDCLYLGLTKSNQCLKKILKSYETQKLCFDI